MPEQRVHWDNRRAPHVSLVRIRLTAMSPLLLPSSDAAGTVDSGSSRRVPRSTVLAVEPGFELHGTDLPMAREDINSAAVDRILSSGTDAVAAALERERIPAPAYAVGLWGNGEEDLDPAVICIGLDRDREAALSLGASESRRVLWNVSDYAIDVRATPDLRSDETFLAAESQALADLYGAGIWDPQQWVYNRVARAVGERRPLAPVTDDFVVFAFHDDFGVELARNLRFSGGAAVSLLQARALLP